MSNDPVARQAEAFSGFRWTLIAIFLAITIVSSFFDSGFLYEISPIVTVLAIFLAMGFNGLERYGLKNILVFLSITWVVSHFFEALSIQVGFPFGNYYYDKLLGPRIFEVPLIIMPAYFGTGYASWMLANILLGQYERRLSGTRIFLVPLVASFIMVIWDLCMDPIFSTVSSLWVWPEGGAYFGVPLKNYFGWFFVVFIIYQCFALYISKYEVADAKKAGSISGKYFWLEPVAAYGIQGLSQLMDFLTPSSHAEIYGPMALVTVLSMMFVTLLAFLAVKNRPRAEESVSSA